MTALMQVNVMQRIAGFTAIFGVFAVAMLTSIQGTLAAPYVLPAADVTDIGAASTDVADSIPGILGDLLPIMVGLFVVTFVVRFIMKKFNQ